MTDGGNDSGAYSTAMSKDGDSSLPKEQEQDKKSGENAKAQEELEDAHRHADPSRGDKEVAGGDHVVTDGAPKHGAADEQATKTAHSF